MVKARTALLISKNVGIMNVKSQWLLMTWPMITDPTVLPNLPNIIEMQIAIALKVALVN